LNEPGGEGGLGGGREGGIGIDEDGGGERMQQLVRAGEGGGPFGDADVLGLEAEPVERGAEGLRGPRLADGTHGPGGLIGVPTMDDEHVAGGGKVGAENETGQVGGGDEGDATEAFEAVGGGQVGGGTGGIAKLGGENFQATALGVADGHFDGRCLFGRDGPGGGRVGGLGLEDAVEEHGVELILEGGGEVQAPMQYDGFVGEALVEAVDEVDEGLAVLIGFGGAQGVESAEGFGSLDEEAGEALLGGGFGVAFDDCVGPGRVEDIEQEVVPGGAAVRHDQALFECGFGKFGAGGDGDGGEAGEIGVAQGAAGAQFRLSGGVDDAEIESEEGARVGFSGEIDVETAGGQLDGGGLGEACGQGEGDKGCVADEHPEAGEKEELHRAKRCLDFEIIVIIAIHIIESRK